MSSTDIPVRPEGQSSHHEEYDEYLAGLPPVYGRKLMFTEKCGLAYALKKGERAEVVCRAFALSRATVSWLAHCLQPGKKHYVDVWDEYQRLGELAFRERYFTPELHFRLKRVRLEIPGEGLDVAPQKSGPDPRSDKYNRKNHGPIIIPDDATHWVVYWIPGGRINDAVFPTGWYFKHTESEGDLADLEPVLGGPYGVHSLRGLSDPEPFRTSSDAFDGVWEFNGLESPRPKPGRPRK